MLQVVAFALGTSGKAPSVARGRLNGEGVEVLFGVQQKSFGSFFCY